MIPKASKALFLTGSHLVVSPSALLWHVMSRQIGASTMSGLGHCSVLLVLIGLIPSMSRVALFHEELLIA